MSARPLKSDQVNYLVWRYLQESGHAQTAARLQRDWGLIDPEKLPFAPHIRTHALVHLLQKGLRYHELETSLDATGSQRPPASFFGPETVLAVPFASRAAPDDDDAASDSSRKHPRDSHVNGAGESTLQPPSAKRSRRAPVNGSARSKPASTADATDAADATPKREPGTATSTRAPSPAPGDVDMDLDAAPAVAPDGPRPKTEEGSGDPPAGGAVADALSPVAESPEGAMLAVAPPVVPTLTHGSSVGVQSEKVADLAPETAVLRVPGTHVTHAFWSPRDPTLLAAAGEALCRLWTIPSSAAPGGTNSPGAVAPGGAAAARVLHPTTTVDLHDAQDGFYVTSMAWSPDGEAIAVAKHPTAPGQAGRISIYDKAGRPLDELPGGQELVLNLHWNPTGTLLLGISHAAGESTVLVWDAENARPMAPLHVPHTVADAAWTDARAFVLCARGLVASSAAAPHGRLEPLTALPDLRRADWARIAHDAHTTTTIVAADGRPGRLGSIAADGRWHDTVAHPDAEITALAFQPLANPAAVRGDPAARRLYATAATDGTVRVWNARRPFECVHTLSLGSPDPALALSFTPDGYLVAAASAARVLFWNADAGGPPRAAWHGADVVKLNGDAHMNGNGVHANGDVAMVDSDGAEAPPPSLSWDADGGKLAYGADSQIAIISFRR